MPAASSRDSSRTASNSLPKTSPWAPRRATHSRSASSSVPRRVAGEAIAGLVNLFNPEVIVIGGAVASAGELFLAEVRQRVYELSLPLATRDLSIVQSLGDVREPNPCARWRRSSAREQLFEVTFPRWFANGRPTIEGVRAPA